MALREDKQVANELLDYDAHVIRFIHVTGTFIPISSVLFADLSFHVL